MRFSIGRLSATAAAAVMLGVGVAAATTFSDRAAFEATLGDRVVDDYEDTGYDSGDLDPAPGFPRFSDAAMSAVIGETQYSSTFFADVNQITGFADDRYYCAGCNGSFTLDFTGTSVGTADGVFGVGFEFFNAPSSTNQVSGLFTAFVTYGDGSSGNIDLGLAEIVAQDFGTFFGLTSDLLIATIAIGLPEGVPSNQAIFGIDNLTVGAAQPVDAAVPLPATLPLMGAALAGLALLRRRRRA